jgi:hypothetical protein
MRVDSLMPFLLLLYIVGWIDRVNVGFAALQMNAALGFSASTLGLGSGIFFVGYCLFEVPSNLVLHRTGARLWIARIMVTWGSHFRLWALVCAAIRARPSAITDAETSVPMRYWALDVFRAPHLLQVSEEAGLS